MLMFSSYYMQLLAPGSHPHKDEISPRAISIFRLARETNARRAAFGALCPAGAFGAVRINS